MNENIDSDIKVWREWYEGFVKSAHQYTVGNGQGSSVTVDRYRLGLAKRICEEFADLLLNEKMEVTCNNSQFEPVLKRILDNNNFYSVANKGLEASFALGTGALVISLDDIANVNENTIRIEFVHRENFEITKHKNGKAIDIKFKSIIDDKTYITSHHKLENGKYAIYNKCFDENHAEIELPQGIAPVVDTQSAKPMFALMMPNVANNKNLTSPYGISVYANALPLLESADIVFDSLMHEYKTGRKRIFVNSEMLKVNEQSGKPLFDLNDTVFYYFEDTQGDMLQESNMTIRASEHIQGLQHTLGILGDKVGLGNDFFNFDNGGVSTATEVISKNASLYRSIRKHEILLRQAVVTLCEKIGELMGVAVDVTVNFDDSIFEDTGTIFNRALTKLQLGLIDKAQFYVETEKMTREQALKFLMENAPQPQPVAQDYELE